MIRKKNCGITCILVLYMSIISAHTAAAEQKSLELTVDDCIEKALAFNLNLKSSRLGMQLNELSVIQQKSAFDPSFNISVDRGESKSPNYAIYIPVKKIESKSTELNMSLGQKLSTGANWGTGFYNTLSESNVEAEKNYSSYFGIQFNQPLLKDFGKKVNRSGIFLAELDGESTLLNIEGNAIDLLNQVLNTYWGLVYSRETLHVFELSHAQADSLLAYNQKSLELGILTESDVLQARSALLAREQDVLDQKNTIRETEDSLKKLLNITDDNDWNLNIIPTDFPEIPEVDLTFDKARQEALQYRPDYQIKLTSMKQNEIRLGVAKNSTKPDLSFNASYRINSSGETVNKDLRDLSDANAYGWNVGLSLNYPIGNRSAKAALEQRQINMRRAQLELEDLENQILTEIRTSIGKVKVNLEKLNVAEVSVEVNELKLKMEEERFRNNLSTSYLVLEYQKDLANALSLYNKALMDYTLAVLEFKSSKGTLLRDLNVNIVSK
ncbi:MAG: TolC family protein [Candidatus Latescibacteria bacterium]|nr:TolC family protein [Candidatus Latescibacterota bacterium]